MRQIRRIMTRPVCETPELSYRRYTVISKLSVDVNTHARQTCQLDSSLLWYQ